MGTRAAPRQAPKMIKKTQSSVRNRERELAAERPAQPCEADCEAVSAGDRPSPPCGRPTWMRTAFHGCFAAAVLIVLRSGYAWEGAFSPQVQTAIRLFWVEALEGGLSGAAAMVVQVVTLLWLRTTMNYQYKHGGSFRAALSILYNEGGIRRLYAGLAPALIQGPISRFGDTAANDGIRAALGALDATSELPSAYISVACSVAAGLFRVLLMPLEVVKTSMQVEGKDALSSLRGRIQRRGPCVLWEGLFATFGAHFAGHLPWFGTRNLLLRVLPMAPSVEIEVGRAAFIGLASSLVADIVSNPIRVIKVTHA